MNGFEKYGLRDEIIKTLDMLKFLQPTPIQDAAIPVLLSGVDLVAKAETGSGKTAAFGIPLCNEVKWEQHLPQALVLEPARELAVQVQTELFQIGRNRRLKVPVVFGGMPVNQELLSLKQKSHIVVGTPGRVMDHIRRESLVLKDIRYVVIDEADLMLDMGFMEEVGEILQHVLKDADHTPALALFSATLDEKINPIIERYMTEPQQVEIQQEQVSRDKIRQSLYCVEDEDKFALLLQVLITENPKDCMIFCDTREMVNTLCHKLKRKGIRCGMLHGGMEQRERLYAINDFRKGKFHYLITTDVAARGIDFEEITHVINYDFPTRRESYVHRIGRTARNGKSGAAISFAQTEEMRYVENAQQYMEGEIPRGDAKSLAEAAKSGETLFYKKQKQKTALREGKEAVFKEQITKLTIGGGRKSKMRPGDVVGAICGIEGVVQEDIGVIDVRDSITYVEIMNGKGKMVEDALRGKTIKGKIRKVQRTRR